MIEGINHDIPELLNEGREYMDDCSGYQGDLRDLIEARGKGMVQEMFRISSRGKTASLGALIFSSLILMAMLAALAAQVAGCTSSTPDKAVLEFIGARAEGDDRGAPRGESAIVAIGRWPTRRKTVLFSPTTRMSARQRWGAGARNDPQAPDDKAVARRNR